MLCPKCHAENMDGSNFCIKCGEFLKPISTPRSTSSTIERAKIEKRVEEEVSEETLEVQEPITRELQTVSAPQPQSYSQTTKEQPKIEKKAISLEPVNYIKYAISVLIKPYASFKKEENKLCDTKNSLIFAGIMSVVLMLLTFLKTMISTVIEKSWNGDVSIQFSNLSELKYIDLIGKNLFLFAGGLAGIALVYYIVGLMFKKDSNYIKLLSKVATSTLPYTVISMVASPILGIIWEPLGIIAFLTGVVYTLIVFITLVNEDFKFVKKDTSIYFHLVSLSVIAVAGYFLLITTVFGGFEVFNSNSVGLFELFK